MVFPRQKAWGGPSFSHRLQLDDQLGPTLTGICNSKAAGLLLTPPGPVCLVCRTPSICHPSAPTPRRAASIGLASPNCDATNATKYLHTCITASLPMASYMYIVSQQSRKSLRATTYIGSKIPAVRGTVKETTHGKTGKQLTMYNNGDSSSASSTGTP